MKFKHKTKRTVSEEVELTVEKYAQVPAWVVSTYPCEGCSWDFYDLANVREDTAWVVRANSRNFRFCERCFRDLLEKGHERRA